jgi:pimeloyl-[acyl-carrier protein] synthase
VHRSFMGGTWVLTRYADVKAVLRDRRVRTLETPKQIKDKNQYIQEKGKELNTLAYVSSQLLFYMNPPDHTRLRRLASKAFSSIVVERMRPYAQETVNELLGKVRNTGFIDIISDLAGPLPVIVIAKVLGVPHEDEDRLHHWSNVLSRILDLLLSLGEYERMNRVVLEFQAYFRDLIAERVKKPKADVISALIEAREQGDKLSEDELLATCILLFATGEETTVNTIGNGMLALLRHPDQMEKLKREPTLIQSAVEELLRYDSPVQITGRLALETIEIGGQTIRAGEKILTCLGAANRDPTQFPSPDRLDLTRRENHHLAFGDGIHYCLGAGLARVQGQIAINTLIQQLPNLALHTDKLEWRKNIALRGLKSLPVTFTP